MKPMLIILVCWSLIMVLSSAVEAQENFKDLFHLLYRFEGIHLYQSFGCAVYLAGDVSGDGYGDLLIGADGENVGSIKSAGAAYVYSGFDGRLLFRYTGENDYAHMGRALSNIEDTDGDELPEIIIGTEWALCPGLGYVGSVTHCSGVDGSIIREYWGDRYAMFFGCDLEGIGDADGDDYGDFIVGAKSYSVGYPLHRGAAYVYSGHTGALLYMYVGEYGGEQLGLRVCRTGDVDLSTEVDKEILGDFAYLSFRNQVGNPPEGGRVTVRSGKDGSCITEIFGLIPDAPIFSLDYGGDINSDGWPDLLVGQSIYNNGSISKAGRAFVYSGKDWQVLYTFVGRIENGVLGGTFSTAGDLNQDGYDDLLIGAPGDNDIGVKYGGAVYVYSGKDRKFLGVLYGDKSYFNIGISLHGGKDINADGLPDVIIGTSEEINGNPYAGSVFVYTSKSLKATDQVPLGGDLELDLRVPAAPMHTYYLAFSTGKDPGIPMGTRTLPLNYDALFSATFGHPSFTGDLDALGNRKITIHIPNDPSLSGVNFYSAFVIYDVTAPMWVRTISNPEMIEIN